MIELMLEAERALAVGLLDKAEGYYRQVATNDPRNAIAIVGLARVALERGDQLTTYLYARKALAIDPDNPAASHLAHRMGEQLAMRGEPIPADDPGAATAAELTAPAADPSGPAVPVARSPVPQPAPSPGPGPAPAALAPRPAPAAPAPRPESPPLRARRRGILDRLRGRIG
jgi:tetratricopeptide (TPR) repeat protein